MRIVVVCCFYDAPSAPGAASAEGPVGARRAGRDYRETGTDQRSLVPDGSTGSRSMLPRGVPRDAGDWPIRCAWCCRPFRGRFPDSIVRRSTAAMMSARNGVARVPRDVAHRLVQDCNHVVGQFAAGTSSIGPENRTVGSKPSPGVTSATASRTRERRLGCPVFGAWLSWKMDVRICRMVSSSAVDRGEDAVGGRSGMEAGRRRPATSAPPRTSLWMTWSCRSAAIRSRSSNITAFCFRRGHRRARPRRAWLANPLAIVEVFGGERRPAGHPGDGEDTRAPPQTNRRAAPPAPGRAEFPGGRTPAAVPRWGRKAAALRRPGTTWPGGEPATGTRRPDQVGGAGPDRHFDPQAHRPSRYRQQHGDESRLAIAGFVRR